MGKCKVQKNFMLEYNYSYSLINWHDKRFDLKSEKMKTQFFFLLVEAGLLQVEN